MSELEEEDIRAIIEYEDELKHGTIEGFVKIIQRRYALKNVTYVSASFAGSSRKDPVLATTYSDEWVKHYKKEQYEACDPTIMVGARSALPVNYAELSWSGKKGKRLFEEVQDAGIGKQGLVIPLRGPVNGVWALMSVMSDDNPDEWEMRREELSKELMYVGHQVHNYACVLYGEPLPEIGMDTLGGREIEALQGLANGASIEEIASVMRVTSRTVKAHLASVRLKLHAASSSHAIMIALRVGLIR
jgi:DNA-binding CsgD family transcriptional regulator